MVRRIGAAYREAFSGLPQEVWLVSIVCFINRSGTMVLPFLSLYLTREVGFTKIQVGGLLAVYGAGSIAGSFLGGWLCDRIGAVRVQIMSLVTAGVTYLIVAQIRQPVLLGIFLFVLSVTAESFRPAAMAAATEFAPKLVITRALALVRLAANLGIAIGPAVGGWLALYDYHWIFVAETVTCWAAAFVVIRRLRGTRPVEEMDGGAARPPGRSPLRDAPFLLLLGVVFLLACVFFQIFATLPLYLREVYGFRENAIGSLLALNAVVIVLTEMLLVRKLEERDEMRVTGIGCLLACAGFALMPFGSSPGWAVVSILVWTVGEMMAFPFVNAVVAHRAGPGSRGRYMGLFTTTFSFAMVAAPVAGTAVYQNLGPDVLWWGAGGIGVLLLIVCNVLAPAFRRKPSA